MQRKSPPPNWIQLEELKKIKNMQQTCGHQFHNVTSDPSTLSVIMPMMSNYSLLPLPKRYLWSASVILQIPNSPLLLLGWSSLRITDMEMSVLFSQVLQCVLCSFWKSGNILSKSWQQELQDTMEENIHNVVFYEHSKTRVLKKTRDGLIAFL